MSNTVMNSPAEPGTPLAPAATQRNAYLPILLIALSTLGMATYHGFELGHRYVALVNIRASQQSAFEDNQKLRAALDRLAADTKRLADQGNSNARLLVSGLEARGITINPDAVNSSAATEGTKLGK